MRVWVQFFLLALSGFLAIADDSPKALTLVNNQPFPIRMPLQVRQFPLPIGTWETSNGELVQADGNDVVLIASVEAGSEKQLTFRKKPFSGRGPFRVSKAEN